MIRVTFHVPSPAYPHHEELRLDVETVPQPGDGVTIHGRPCVVTGVRHVFERDSRSNTRHDIIVVLGPK